jgi:hypothetical protein
LCPREDLGVRAARLRLTEARRGANAATALAERTMRRRGGQRVRELLRNATSRP